MSDDPWSRPSLEDLKMVLKSFEQKPDTPEQRASDRLELTIPTEIITSRGNSISAVTREISRNGVGMLHRGAIQPGEVTIKMTSETRVFTYRVDLKWCTPCDNGMFVSGGEFLGKTSSPA